MNASLDTVAFADLLDWYRAMGVDTATGGEAINWLERGDRAPGRDFALISAPEAQVAEPQEVPRPAPARQPTPPRAAVAPLPNYAPTTETRQFQTSPEARQFPTAPPDAAETAARRIARESRTLADLEAALRTFDGCALKATAKNLCFYRGAAKARVMIVGEAPGRDEDIEGKPFVGRAGQLLDKMLRAIGLSEENVHITNIVYWRPPGNRTPTPQEGQICRPFLERQIELVEPDILVLLGGAAAKHVLNVAEGIMRIRGKWRETAIGTRKIKTIATLHPAYLLRTPAAKRQAWRDLLAIDTALKETASQ
jgi:DNA polymerase